MDALGFSLILVGWVLFIAFLILPLSEGSGWITIRIPGFVLFAAAFLGLKDAAGKGLGNFFGRVLIAGTAFCLSIPTLVVPILAYVGSFGDVRGIVDFGCIWFSTIGGIAFVSCSLVLALSPETRYDARFGFYALPLSYPLIAAGFFLI